MSRVCQIVLVCEDWRQSAFARGFLVASGVDRRSVDPKVNPGGSGHDWVKDQFVKEVANFVRFSEGRGILGLLDEDGMGVETRELEVTNRLKAAGLPRVAATEGRCLLLPARNIETWLYWLRARQVGAPVVVDETTNYKVEGPPAGGARLSDEHCRPAGEYLHSLNHTSTPEGCPPLLDQALRRLREFLNAVRR